jgi:syntaxin 8
MSTTPHQLFLLADHVKLSLLERQRAKSLNLPSGTHHQDGPLTRSLESLRQGIEALHAQAEEQESIGGDVKLLNHQLSQLQSQYTELDNQFNASSAAAAAAATSNTLVPTNDPLPSSTSSARNSSSSANKNVRFNTPYRDEEPDDQETANRNKLFPSQQQQQAPYTDDPTTDQSSLTNTQIHTYHKQVLSQQDTQLDTLGQSISRQRLLGIQMGDEMDAQNAMLDDVERGTDRFQTNLDRARGRLGKVARKAKDNWSWVTIACLMLILVLLLVLLG